MNISCYIVAQILLWGRFCSESKACKELTSMMVIPLGEIIVKDSVVNLVNKVKSSLFILRENGFVDANPTELLKTFLGDEAVMNLASAKFD